MPWPVDATIIDSDIDFKSPFVEDIAIAFYNRDAYVYFSDPSGNIETMINKFLFGHLHSDTIGTTGEGNQIPSGGIDDSGIHKSIYIADGSIDHGKIALNTMQAEDFALNSVTNVKWKADYPGNPTGLGSGIFQGGPFNPVAPDFDPIAFNINHGMGRLVVPSRYGSEFFFTGIGSNSVSVKISDRLPKDIFGQAASPWSYKFRVV